MLQSTFAKTINPTFMETVVSFLKIDDISMVVRNDNIILKVGENLFTKHGTKQKQYISQEMRLLGRLVQKLRSICGNENGYLRDFLHASNFDSLIEAAQLLSNKIQTKDSCSFETPSVALKIGPVLKKCCTVIKGNALRQSDEQAEKDATNLISLINDEWAMKVSSIALRSRKEQKRNQPVCLPKTDDLVMLKDYLIKEIEKAREGLQEDKTSRYYFKRLSEAVLVRIIMFNRRRSGEVSKIGLDEYTHRPVWTDHMNKEIFSSLKPMEQYLAKRLDLIEIRGKRERTVPVILTPDMKDALDMLVACRSTVDDENTFLFPRLKGLGHLDGHKCIKAFAEEAGLEKPETIGSTAMRKYVATVIQMLCLNEGEIEWLSNRLGHSINIHKEVYRHQESTVELGRVAKMLLAVDNGKTLMQKDNEDDIDIAGQSDSSESEEESEVYDNTDRKDDDDEGGDVEEEENSENDRPNKTRRKTNPVQKVSWTTEELEVIKKRFGAFFRLLKVPGKAECEAAISAENCLKDRSWKSVKYCVYNKIQRLRKNKI